MKGGFTRRDKEDGGYISPSPVSPPNSASFLTRQALTNNPN